jgi:hypothetical protein
MANLSSAILGSRVLQERWGLEALRAIAFEPPVRHANRLRYLRSIENYAHPGSGSVREAADELEAILLEHASETMRLYGCADETITECSQLPRGARSL